MDFERRQVTVHGVEVHLTPTEYEVLKYLAANSGKVITHRTLLRAVWGPSYEDETHYLRVFIGQLRRKIEPDPTRPRYLVTDPGVGYRLRVPD
jgi:two-component system KDP operon response regulator KdpE